MKHLILLFLNLTWPIFVRHQVSDAHLDNVTIYATIINGENWDSGIYAIKR